MWYACSYMSSARIGTPPASAWVWSAAHWLTSVPSRGWNTSSTQPEPPPSALPMAMNSSRQRSTLPKLASSASLQAGSIDWPSPPRLPKYSSCSSIELVAISSSRFRPLSWKPGAVAKAVVLSVRGWR